MVSSSLDVRTQHTKAKNRAAKHWLLEVIQDPVAHAEGSESPQDKQSTLSLPEEGVIVISFILEWNIILCLAVSVSVWLEWIMRV